MPENTVNTPSILDTKLISSNFLLNQGLPWSNPQKITIGSDEHILDTTINRGLMMLLQNDYYLESRRSFIF